MNTKVKFSIHFCLILNFGQLQKNVTTCPFRRVVNIIHNKSFFFFYLGFFHKHSRFTWQQRKGEGIYLTPLYHFHPLHRQLDIIKVITAESSSLHIASIVADLEPGFSERKSLTTKLRPLKTDHSKIAFVQPGYYVQ